jgi:Protein of unknown function (DUF4230)
MIILKLFKRSKNKKRIRNYFKFSLVLILILLICNLFWVYKSHSNKIKYRNINNLKISSEESLIREIRNVNKIIPLEVELSQVITIDKSWGDFEIFQKFKRIKIFAKCSYSIDLSQITNDDINIENEKNKITVSLSKPEIFSINIDRDKTVYEDASNGLLRFGEIKLTSEEFEAMQNEVYKNFETTMKTNDIYNKVISNTKVSLEKLIDQITEEKMDVYISFK